MAKTQDGKDKPVGPPPRVGHLDTVSGVLREMATVYREVRRGKTDAERGCKLVYMLREMRGCLEAQQLEQMNARLEELAQLAESRYGSAGMGREQLGCRIEGAGADPVLTWLFRAAPLIS